jgi:hypothetical protein
VRVQQERHAIVCTWRVQKKRYERTSASETGLWGRGGTTYVPKHDKNVRDVVHAAFVHVSQFFVGRGHEL